MKTFIPTPVLHMSGESARIIINNCHTMLRYKFKRRPLWSMVASITGHGSGYSQEICFSANLDPHQDCGKTVLKDLPKNL